ncbi:nanos homolog 1 isoform X2 [Leptopilina boulardi]|uniref:nanos homolog 1 isoform X2 n=1 Tax=Leptopilina boulardi TaxID=63433 RepID=UPI0021F543F4|nr:nanos homolog 1 isoform X2 [Leptopilina boulardi]
MPDFNNANMMKYTIHTIILPHTNVQPTFVQQKLPWPQQHALQQAIINARPNENEAAKFFPLHLSLEDEINRLLISDARATANWGSACKPDVMDEFRSNGRDYEFLSDNEEDTPKPLPRRRKNKKPLPTECVFCKNNGEQPMYYKSHILKDGDGKVVCPILRRYQCPICQALGDDSHTLKYCPKNPKPSGVPIVSALKTLRNSSGKKGRSK